MSKRWQRVLAWLGFCVSLWVAPRRAEAEREVRITIAADARSAGGLEAVFLELLARLPVSLTVTRALAIEPGAVASPDTPGPAPFALVWVDLTKRGAAILYLLDVGTDRVLVRRVRREPGGGELVQEELGHILQTSVEGLLAGETVGVPRQEILPLLEPGAHESLESTEPPKPVVAPARAEAVPVERNPRPAAGLHGRATLLYAVALLGREAPLSHGPELGISAHTAGPVEPGIWLGFQWRLPVRASAGPVSARFSQLSPRGLFTGKLFGNETRSLRLGLGAGADVVRVETSSSDRADIGVEAPSTRVFAIARAALLLDWHLWGALRMAAALDIDVDGSGARYVFSSRAGERALLEPYPLRPALALGIAAP